MKKLLKTALALSLSLTALCASAVTINFENLAVGTVLSNQYAGVTFAANAFTGPGSSSSGQPWATNTDMTIVLSTGADVGGLGTPLLVSGNLLRSFNGWLGENGDPSFRISFGSAINSFSAAFAGVSTAADVRVFAYNGANLLGTVAGSSTGQFVLSFAAASITSVVLTPGSFNDWVGVDNINYTTAVVGVPEPETYALMALGLAAVALARRRAKSLA
jgi:hypothetical protein